MVLLQFYKDLKWTEKEARLSKTDWVMKKQIPKMMQVNGRHKETLFIVCSFLDN